MTSSAQQMTSGTSRGAWSAKLSSPSGRRVPSRIGKLRFSGSSIVAPGTHTSSVTRSLMCCPALVLLKASKSITRYSPQQTPPRVKYVSHEDARDKPGTEFAAIVFFVFRRWQIIDFDTKRKQQIVQFAHESEFIWCCTNFPYIDEVVECTITPHRKMPVTPTEA